MNKDIKTTEYLEKMKNLKLSSSSRNRIQDNLLEYAKFHGVRVGVDGRSIKQVPQRTSLFILFKSKFMNAALIALMLMVGGGTSFAAQGAIPGDMLYPIKTEVNEPMMSVFAVGANAEVELQAKLVAKRVAEAEELKAKGEFSDEFATKISANIKEHTEKTDSLISQTDAAVKVKTATNLQLSLNKFNTLVENDSQLAIKSTFVSSDSDTETNSQAAIMLSTGKMSPEALRVNTIARVENLTRVVGESKSELSSEAYVSLSTKLDKANKLVVDSKTQAEVESQQSLMEAGKIAGEVESTLTTLGTVKIEENTGAVVDIDFSRIPAKEIKIMERPTEGDGVTSESEVNTQIKTNVNSNTRMNTDVTDTEIKPDAAATSGINL